MSQFATQSVFLEQELLAAKVDTNSCCQDSCSAAADPEGGESKRGNLGTQFELGDPGRNASFGQEPPMPRHLIRDFQMQVTKEAASLGCPIGESLTVWARHGS